MKIGDKIRITSDNDNYDKFRNLDLTITHIAHNIDEHPGYDTGMNGMALVDCENIAFSLYEYEFMLI